MKMRIPLLFAISLFVILILDFAKSDAVCTETMWINELKQDVADNGKLDCLRRPIDPPKDKAESEEDIKKRNEGQWDTDCSFEADYDWFTPLKERYGLKSGLVDRDGKSVDNDFDDQADMCEIVRALIAGGVLEGVRLDQLSANSFKDLECPGIENKAEICAVSGGSAAQNYAWTILLESKSIEVNEKPKWEMDVKSKENLDLKKIAT